MAQSHESHVGYHDGICTLCGERSTAFWVGDVATIGVCEPCALDKLPRLIADALTSDHRDRFIAAARRIETAFAWGVVDRLGRKVATIQQRGQAVSEN